MPTQPDFETIKNLFIAIKTGTDREADRASGRVESLLGASLYDKLDDLGLEPTSPAFEMAFRDLDFSGPAAESKPEKAEKTAVPELCDLLPFPNMALKARTDPVPIPGYLIDQWCRPHGTGPRRKKGPLAHRHYWQQGKFRTGYKITLNGQQRRKPDWWFAMAREKAEKLRKQAEE
jgi:hypothetical protein